MADLKYNDFDIGKTVYTKSDGLKHKIVHAIPLNTLVMVKSEATGNEYKNYQWEDITK